MNENVWYKRINKIKKWIIPRINWTVLMNFGKSRAKKKYTDSQKLNKLDKRHKVSKYRKYLEIKIMWFIKKKNYLEAKDNLIFKIDRFYLKIDKNYFLLLR